MNSRLIGAILLVTVAGVSATSVYNPTSFCQRYAIALFGASDSASETSLIQAVVNRALNGKNDSSPVVVGVLNQGNQKTFFDGTACTGCTNFYTDATKRTNLVNALYNFFEYAMGCRDISPAPTTPANMATVHQAFSSKITSAVWNTFVGEIVNTLTSYGVNTTAPGPMGEAAYLVPLLGQFLKGSSQVICADASCAGYNTFGEFTSGSIDGALKWVANDGTTSVAINTGGFVHWNIGTAHFVQPTDSSYAPTTTGTPIQKTNLGVDRTLTIQFPTAGTYYFKCGVAAHEASMRATVVVTDAPTGGSSTGGSGAATLSTSVAVVAAAIVAAFALKH